MPTDRAGYNLTVFAIDVSTSMRDKVAVGEDGVKRSKLDLAKEYVARSCEPRISSGRKTEAVGILSFGGHTNNQAYTAARREMPEEEEYPYQHIACDVAIQTVRPKTLEVVMNLEQGRHEGNPVSALMVALDMVSVHKHTKSWSLEVVLITDGESAFVQDEYEDLITRFEDLGVKLTVLGVGFNPLGETVDKSKTRNKRLSEKFWRTFVQMLHDRFSGVNASDDFLPTIQVFDDALVDARLPHPEQKNGTVSNIDILIGSPDIDEDQAIRIPVKYSKATMKARPPTLSRAWRPAMDLQAPLHPTAQRPFQTPQSQLLSSYLDQQSQQHGHSQAQSQGQNAPASSDIAGMISSEVKGYSTYVIKKEPAAPPPASQDDVIMADSQAPASQKPGTQARTQADAEDAEEEEEEVVAKEDLVKAWRFGSTWVPMEADTFEPLATQKGVEVLGFFPRANLKRHHLMGEVRFVWPDLTDSRAQIKFSSFVAGLVLREMVAVVRWVLKDQAEPVIGVCIPEQDFPGDDKRLDFLFWVRLPFAEDEHNFWFPSLTTYKTAAGKVLEEHPLLPTDEQCDLMESFVQAMDLDAFAEANGTDDEPGEPWFDTVSSYNPAIHRIKEAIFHASLTRDLDQDPLGPPHPEIVKYLNPPQQLVQKSETIVEQLKEALEIKKVPAKVRMQKRAKEGLREDEGYIDIDALFDDDEEEETAIEGKGKIKGEPTTPSKKPQTDPSSTNGKNGNGASPQVKDEPNRTPSKHKPKRGRIISNEAPLEDFNRLISGEGDVFRKAIQDLGAVVKENVEASFSRQAFPLAIECLQAMRKTALVYEEVDTYNTYLEDLEAFIKDPKFKHKDFWKAAEDAGDAVRAISEEEEEAALQD